MKFMGKEDEGEREEFVFEEFKQKPKAKSYPHVSFGRFKNAKDQQVLLSHFSGPMRLGGHDAQVKISFSHLVAVQIQDVTEKSPSPATEESDENLVNRGIEKAKNGDLDGAMADFDRAIELNPKNDAPFYNRAQAKRLKKDAAGAIADYTRAIELGSQNQPLTTTAATPERRITTGMAQLLIIRTRSNSNPITRAPTTIALLRSRRREMRPVLRPTSRLPGNSIRNWPATSWPRIQKAILLRELRQSVSWMASSSSTCPLIFRVIPTTQRTKNIGQILRPGWSVGNGLARHARARARQAGRLSQNARGRVRQRIQMVTEGFPSAMAKERHREDQWPQMG